MDLRIKNFYLNIFLEFKICNNKALYMFYIIKFINFIELINYLQLMFICYG